MRITSIDNSMNFQARFRISKPVATKLALGTTALTTGIASLYTGADALDIIPNSGLVNSICENINNEHIVQTEKGLVVVDNEMDALHSGMAMAASLPLGSTFAPLGSHLINKANKELNTDIKKIPN